ncbi:MAG: phosphoribosylglycinamide formyltransferase [Micavibrio sp.]
MASARMTQKIRLGILISGRGSNMESLIRACAAPDYPAEVALVLSNKPAAPGLEKARQSGIMTTAIDQKTYTDRSEFEAALHKTMINHRVDLICLAGFMRILSPDFVHKWPDRILNIHPSLLPAYPGLNTHERALADRQSESGCTVHLVTPDLDAGPVVLQRAVPVLPQDTPDTLASRILEQEHIAYPQAVHRIAENLLKSLPTQG